MQVKSKFDLYLACTAAVVAMSGCGGGGSGAPANPSTPGQAQGVYTGSFSSGTFNPGKFSSLILDNDEYWTLYGLEGASGELIVYGLIQGQGAASSGSFSSSNLKDYYYDGTTGSGTLSATYTPGTSFSGTVSTSGRSVSFAGAAAAPGSSLFNYNTAATMSSITGAWSGSNMAGVTSSYTIADNGTFSGVNQYGCGFSGTVTPRASGKNVFDVALTNNTDAACGIASGLVGRGVALTSLLTGGSRQLIVAVATNDRAYGSAIFAIR